MQTQCSGWPQCRGPRLKTAIAVAIAWFACGPEKVMRGPQTPGGGGAHAGLGGAASGAGGALAGSGGTASGNGGAGGAGHGGSSVTGGAVSSGGDTYVPPTSVGSGGTTAVTWSTPTIDKDASVVPVCRPAPAPTAGRPHKILMVVKSIASPSTIPPLLKSHLAARGFQVDYAFIYTSSYKTDAGSVSNLWFFDDAKTQIVDVSQYGLAVITKDGYKSGANLDTIPVLCGNNQTADSALAMASSDGSSSSTKSAFTLIDPTHPIAAQKTGDKAGTIVLETGSSADMKIVLATVPSTAHVVGVDFGTPAPGTSAAAFFAYDAGDVLANGSAAKARRVGFFLDDSTSWGLVAAGSITWEFFDASVDWLLGLPPCSGADSGTAVDDAGVTTN